MAAIKHFCYLLEGRSFTVFTDQRLLVRALTWRSDPWSSQQQRLMLFIAEFLPTICHIAGQSNVVADSLSRLTGGTQTAPTLHHLEGQCSPPPPLASLHKRLLSAGTASSAIGLK